jgi:hypothetical protein
MNFYEWYVLPETPSYRQEYRDKFKLKTVKKMFGINEQDNEYNGKFERESEIVVSSYSYTEQDYKQMWVSYAWYRTFWTAGFLADTIEKIKVLYGVSLGEFTRRFYNNFFTDAQRSGPFLSDLNNNINSSFDEFVNTDNNASKFLIDAGYIKDADPVKLFAFIVFLNLKEFKDPLVSWINAEWPKLSMIEIAKDIDCTITHENFKTKQGIILRRYYYNEVFADETQLDKIMEMLSVYLSSSIPVPPLKFLRSKTVII